jgi:hypothetical protein
MFKAYQLSPLPVSRLKSKISHSPILADATGPAGAFNPVYTGRIDPFAAFWVSIVPSLCLFPSCMNISARIFPELTPAGIMEIIINAKNFLTHSDDPATPYLQASLYPACDGSLQPCSNLKAKPLEKDRGTGCVKPDASRAVQ